jgi:hypothetical protein
LRAAKDQWPKDQAYVLIATAYLIRCLGGE